LERQEEGLKKHKIDLEEKTRLSRMLPIRAVLEKGFIEQQKIAYEERVALMTSRALEDYRWRKLAKARYMLEEDNEHRQQEEEDRQDKIKREEEARLQQEEYARIRFEREEKEALEKEREAEAEKARKEKAAAMEIIRAEAAEAHRIAAEIAAAKKAAEPPVVERERERESAPEDEGEWKKQGPTGRVPINVASTKTEDGAAAPWKASRPSGGGGLESAFGGNNTTRRPTFGAGATGGDRGLSGETSGWRGSRGNDAPAPAMRGGADWGG
jgi:septal ring factor EnvC (AmiA/AmiB activator)